MMNRNRVGLSIALVTSLTLIMLIQWGHIESMLFGGPTVFVVLPLIIGVLGFIAWLPRIWKVKQIAIVGLGCLVLVLLGSNALATWRSNYMQKTANAIIPQIEEFRQKHNDYPASVSDIPGISKSLWPLHLFGDSIRYEKFSSGFKLSYIFARGQYTYTSSKKRWESSD